MQLTQSASQPDVKRYIMSQTLNMKRKLCPKAKHTGETKTEIAMEKKKKNTRRRQKKNFNFCGITVAEHTINFKR